MLATAFSDPGTRPGSCACRRSSPTHLALRERVASNHRTEPRQFSESLIPGPCPVSSRDSALRNERGRRVGECELVSSSPQSLVLRGAKQTELGVGSLLDLLAGFGLLVLVGTLSRSDCSPGFLRSCSCGVGTRWKRICCRSLSRQVARQPPAFVPGRLGHDAVRGTDLSAHPSSTDISVPARGGGISSAPCAPLFLFFALPPLLFLGVLSAPLESPTGLGRGPIWPGQAPQSPRPGSDRSPALYRNSWLLPARATVSLANYRRGRGRSRATGCRRDILVRLPRPEPRSGAGLASHP